MIRAACLFAAALTSTAAPVASAQEAEAPGPRGRHQLGGGVAVLFWAPANNPLTLRVEGEYRLRVAEGWRLFADLSYVAIGKSGDALSEDGVGVAAGVLREWAVGPAEAASFFPHARVGLVFEATSTRHASSSKFIAVRGGPGIDWRLVPQVSLSLGLEIGMGLLAIGAGSGDAAKFELTIGGALRLLYDLG